MIFPELEEIEKLREPFAKFGRVRLESTVEHKELKFPIYSFCLGPDDPTMPTLLFSGGVHGIEKIGTQILISFMHTVIELMKWDDTIHDVLSGCRLLFYPLVNPSGMFHRTRANSNGVDLMRNAPIDANPKDIMPLLGGHRISSMLPWYRGKFGAPLENEAQALCNFVRREVFPASVSISVDIHSGFGTCDRFWFPYAKNKLPFPKVAEVLALKNLLDQTFPNHVYFIEPQSLSYCTHGDLWDYLFEEHYANTSKKVYLPFALELGSWIWVKKNPRQLASILGAFNPILPHRRQRTLRRHITLFDFLLRAVRSNELWSQLATDQRQNLENDAKALWFDRKKKGS